MEQRRIINMKIHFSEYIENPNGNGYIEKKHTVRLIDRDLKVAKETIKHFLDTSKEEAEKKGATAYYYTLLIAMHVISNDMIKTLTPEVLAMILNAAADESEYHQ